MEVRRGPRRRAGHHVPVEPEVAAGSAARREVRHLPDRRRPARAGSRRGAAARSGRPRARRSGPAGRTSRPPGRVVDSRACLSTGEYEPSSQQWVRDQVELYESSGGTEGTTLRDTGLPVVIITNLGASSGKLRKTPLMRVEHEGRYAAIASQGGAPKHPAWYANFLAAPAGRAAGRAGQARLPWPARCTARSASSGGSGRWPPSRRTPSTSARPSGSIPVLRAGAGGVTRG